MIEEIILQFKENISVTSLEKKKKGVTVRQAQGTINTTKKCVEEKKRKEKKRPRR